MRNVFRFLQKNVLRIIIVLAIVLFVSAQILRILTPPTPPKIQSQDNTWNSITPGFSTGADVVQRLGQPINSRKIDNSDNTELDYISPYPAQPNQVVVDPNAKVQFIKQYVGVDQKEFLQDYVNKFGNYDLALVDPQTGEADRVYVFANKGVAIIAHIADGSVEQKWYFTPTTAGNFLTSWGNNLTNDENKRQGL